MRALRTLLVIASLTALGVGLQSAAAPHEGTTRAVAAMTSKGAAANISASLLPEAVEADDARRANEVLSGLKARYRYLGDVTVTMGTTPKGEEAVAYYTEGRIIISRTHTVSIDKILAHEVWHVIDWRDNGQLDWQESLPPSSISKYLKGTS